MAPHRGRCRHHRRHGLCAVATRRRGVRRTAEGRPQPEEGGSRRLVESVKAASDVYAPISGEVLEVNSALTAEPALVNSDAGGNAWFFKLKIADKSELDGLMDEAAYAKHTA